MTALNCRAETRRPGLFGQTSVAGLDYLDVGPDQKRLVVYFIGRAPRSLTNANCHRFFRVEGGRRIRGIKVTSGEVLRRAHEPPRAGDEPWLDDEVRLRLDRAGDFSVYTLRLVDLAETIDPVYDHLDFSFKVDCPSDLDCATEIACSETPRREPEISYLAKDFESFRQLIYDRLAMVMPGWRERHVPDLGVTLVELLAYAGDHLSYYQDAVATEAYLDTARRRISVRRHARLVDYFLHDGCNARAWVCIEIGGVDEKVELDPADLLFVTSLETLAPGAGPVLPRHALETLPTGGYLLFEPLVETQATPITLWPSHNRIRFYAWGQRGCCLPEGATNATLRDEGPVAKADPGPSKEPYGQGLPTKPLESQAMADVEAPVAKERPARALRLSPGDILVFEEVLGPVTGEPADADPAHRHTVRLTNVERAVDPLDGTLVLEISWAEADALPFALCLSAVTDPGHGCVFIEDVSVAHGNVVLVDHGETLGEVDVPGAVPTELTEADCHCPCHPGDVTARPGRYEPRLDSVPLTFSEPAVLTGPAADATTQDPRRAMPNTQLSSNPGGHRWLPQRDLLASDRDDRHFVVEIDNEGRANLRFGDGECGLRPEAGATFSAACRVGNGRAGNVGAEAIRHLVYRRRRPDAITGLRNPLPARGGADPEPIAEAKLLAPSAIRETLQRAVVAADYATIAGRNSAVQRAAARLCWTGSWYEARVAIDPLGGATLSEALAREIEQDLGRYRRIGHDLRIVPAQYVPLDIGLAICVRRDHQQGYVKAALLRAFGVGVLPNGQPAFFHADKLSFGDGVEVSRLVAAALAVDGVESLRIARLQRQFERPDHELENGVLPIGALEIARCDNDPSFPEHGRLELAMIGGI